MNHTEYFLLVFGMALVTYLPRLIPSLIIDKMRFGANTEKFLRLIPFTAITSLIFPGVFFVDGANPLIGIVAPFPCYGMRTCCHRRKLSAILFLITL